ncbi:uncharacterized protein LOC144650716 isoform X2 [Oculina patagonica]
MDEFGSLRRFQSEDEEALAKALEISLQESTATKTRASSKGELAIPLCLPDNCKWDPQTGKSVKTSDKRSSLYVIEEALEQLREVKGPVCVVSITGPCRSGKSYILSEAFDQPEVFPLGHKMDPETMGIWLWIVPEKYKDSKGREFTVVLLDSEGIDAAASEGFFDDEIFTLTLLLASVLVYNSKGVPKRRDMEGLDFVAKLSRRIQIRSNTRRVDDQSDVDFFYLTFPHFIWLLRDAMQAIPSDCKDIKEYFLKRVFKEQATSATDHKSKQVAVSILRFFPGFDAFMLPPPTANPEMLKSKNEKKDKLNPSFLSGLEKFKQLIKTNLSPKKSFYTGEFVTGEGLAALVQLYVNTINSPDAIPNVQSAWDNFVAAKCYYAKQVALKTYDALLASQLTGELPCSNDVMRMSHSYAFSMCEDRLLAEMSGLSINTVKKVASERKESVVNKLNTWLTENEAQTRQFCKDLLGKLKRIHLDPVLQKLQGKEAAEVSFDDVISGYSRIKDDYHSSAKGAKDVIAAVFFEFHPELMPGILKQLKVFDEKRSQYLAAQAYEDQERKRLEEQQSLLQEEKRQQKKEMKMLLRNLREEQERFTEQMNSELKAQQAQLNNMMVASMKQVQEERVAFIQENQALKDRLLAMQEQTNAEISAKLDELIRQAPPESSVGEVQVAESSDVVTSEGGSVSMNGVTLTCPPGAVDDSVIIKLKLEEPHEYCGLLVQRGLENDVIFDTPMINCQPNGATFRKRVTLKVALDKGKERSTANLFVLHGTPTTKGRIFWEDITHNTKFDLEKEELEVKITQFSLIAVLLRLPQSTWIQFKEVLTRLNFLPFKYTMSVLFKSNHQHSPFDELAVVFLSHDIYQEELHRECDHSAIMQLRSSGFEELSCNTGQERNYVYNEESLTVSIKLGEDYELTNKHQECVTFAVDSSVWWSTGHVIKLQLQGSISDAKVLCGRIAVQGQRESIREDYFCQLDLCGYIRRLLGVEKAIFNLKPVTLKLELTEETMNQVLNCWQSEAEQLEMILLRWRENQANTEDFAMLRKALIGLKPEDYRVKERGQMHIEHLRELAVTIVGLQHKDPNMMEYLGSEIKKLCNSVLRDCCIEIATSKEDLDLATSTENCASLLEIHKQISKYVADKYRQMCCSPEDLITESFLMVVPQLVQAIKEIFRDERIPQVQNGLRGVSDEKILTKITSDLQEAAKNKSIFKLLSEVCKILEILCLENNDSRSTEDEIREWGGSATIIVMLQFLEKFFQGFEAQRLYKRLHVFSVAIRDILSNPSAFEGHFLRDFHNVALSLLKFAKFDPSLLLRFELNDPTNSSNTQGNDELKYNKSKETFSQLFWISKESEDDMHLEAAAHVHINGHIRTIGAYESLIQLPAFCSEAIDTVSITSRSVAVKREQDDSENLRVTLYATQKGDVKAALSYLEKELGTDLIDLKQTKITQSHLKLRSFAKSGTVVKLRLVHKWGSEAVVIDSNDFVALADSTAGGIYEPNPEIEAEIGQLAIRNEITALPIASDSTVGNYSSSFVMDPSDAELVQRHLHEQRGHVEIHYHQNFLKGHVCVAGMNTSLNVQMPATATGQRFLGAAPGVGPQRSLTAGTDATNASVNH